MPNQSAREPSRQAVLLDRVFHGLADPTRRAVLARLSKGPASTSELAEPFDMALPSFTQHLGVLEDCGLVRSRKQGRVRTYELSPRPLQTAETWISKQRTVWEKRVDQPDTHLASLHPSSKTPTK
jgi:DNA-binding transcriptional ArsR family regulator